MVRKNLRITLVILLIAALVLPGCRLLRRPDTANPGSGGAKFEIMGFYEKGWSGMTNGMTAVTRHFNNMTLFMPWWYEVNTAGTVGTTKDNPEPNLVKFLSTQPNARVLPLVINKDGATEMLNNAGIRAKAVKGLADLVKRQGYTGLTIDFELLSPQDRDGLTSFTTDLAKALHGMKKSIGITVFPKVKVSSDVSGAYNYPALAKVVDYLIVMTYDRHSESSGPGSVAPISWVESNIKYALDNGVPKDKLVMGLSAYGFDWPEGGKGEYLGIREIRARAKDAGAKIQRDTTTRSPYFTYTAKDGTKHTVWFEDGQSAAERVALARKYGIRGAAIWRIGFEDEDYWTRVLAEARKGVTK